MTSGRPHVFLIVGDCLRAASVSEETMPYVTGAADHSAGRCFAPSTWTFPSFATLYTGETPLVHGATRRGEVLEPSQEGSRAYLPEYAGDEGYYPAIFSENPTFSQTYGFHHGVDLVDDSINFKPFVSSFSAENHASRISADAVSSVATELLRRPDRLRNALNTAYGAMAYLRDPSPTEFPHNGERVFDHVSRVARSSGDRPLFCIANFLEPHDPHHAPPALGARALGIDVPDDERAALWAARDTKEFLLRREPTLPADATTHFDSWEAVFQREEDVYRAQIRYFDALFERWYEGLPPDVRENSLVIVTGDHGQLFGEEGMVHHQTSLHPRAVEVPLYVFLPEDWKAGGESTPAASPAGSSTAAHADSSLESPMDSSGEGCSWLGLSRALRGVLDGSVRGAGEFADAIVDRSAPDGEIVVTVDGPAWNTSVLEAADGAYDRDRIEALKVRRVGLVDGDEQIVHESAWNETAITTHRYELTGTTRRHLESEPAADLDPDHREWLLEPTDDDEIDARASARLEQLGYL